MKITARVTIETRGDDGELMAARTQQHTIPHEGKLLHESALLEDARTAIETASKAAVQAFEIAGRGDVNHTGERPLTLRERRVRTAEAARTA